MDIGYAVVIVSEVFLTKRMRLDWENWELLEVLAFVEENCTEVFEDMSPYDILQLIKDTAQVLVSNCA